MKEDIELIVGETRMEFKRSLILECSNSHDRSGGCLPEEIIGGSFYGFNIRGYAIFPLGEAISLFERGEQNPVASIQVVSQTQSMSGGLVNTSGEYLVRVCSKDYNEGAKRLK